VVALVRGVHGLRGRIRVEVLTDHPDLRFTVGSALFPEGGNRTLTIVEAQPVADGPGWWLDLREIGDRDAAEALRGRYLEALVAPDELPEGDVYWHEVVGVPVVGLDGAALGTVEEVYRAGAAEVLVLRGGPHGELDVPNVASIVRAFAPREGRIVVDAEALDLDPSPRPRRPRGRRTRRALAAGGPVAAAGPGDGSVPTASGDGGGEDRAVGPDPEADGGAAE
jgi:16S rRNA processing protein RimM